MVCGLELKVLSIPGCPWMATVPLCPAREECSRFHSPAFSSLPSDRVSIKADYYLCAILDGLDLFFPYLPAVNSTIKTPSSRLLGLGSCHKVLCELFSAAFDARLRGRVRVRVGICTLLHWLDEWKSHRKMSRDVLWRGENTFLKPG